ncbi:MAG TPA: hypothetical protein VHC49_09215 [Mycobacteriales bacterium]|nr:hypothetical protein [Mycobacteriales bacterium]
MVPFHRIVPEATINPDVVYRENSAGWRPFWILCAMWTLGVIVDGILGSVHWWGWLLALLAVGGVFGVVAYAKARFSAVLVDRAALRIGQEIVPLSTVDVTYFAEDSGGPPAGARILGGAWSIPKGRSALPVRLIDGTVVLAPCRDPEGLRAALQNR